MSNIYKHRNYLGTKLLYFDESYFLFYIMYLFLDVFLFCHLVRKTLDIDYKNMMVSYMYLFLDVLLICINLSIQIQRFYLNETSVVFFCNYL